MKQLSGSHGGDFPFLTLRILILILSKKCLFQVMYYLTFYPKFWPNSKNLKISPNL